jgi:hypothetical protein
MGSWGLIWRLGAGIGSNPYFFAITGIEFDPNENGSFDRTNALYCYYGKFLPIGPNE